MNTVHCICFIFIFIFLFRSCLNFLQGLNMPEKPLYLIQQLAINVRMLCAETLFYRTGKG